MMTAAPTRQLGIVLLAFSLVLLLAVSSLTIFSAHNIAVAHRLAANDLHASRSTEAAFAGLDTAISQLSEALPTVNFDRNGWFDHSLPPGVLQNGASYTAHFYNIGHQPYDTSLLQIEVTGLSTDRSSAYTVRQLAYYLPYLAAAPTAPLIGRGTIVLSGPVTIQNRTYSVAARAGGDIEITAAPPRVETTLDAGERPPLQALDPALEAETSDVFYARLFHGLDTPNQDEASASPCRCDSVFTPDRPTRMNADRLRQLSRNLSVGSQTQPVLMIVPGNLDLDHPIQIYGVVYVHGSIRLGGQGNSIHGSLIAGDDILVDGVSEFVYDEAIVEHLAALGRYLKVAGSWHDF